ncbi:hypothetical protein Q5P01_011172 [Channa striata]|uniref:Pentraxin family member n=1 Tax=Channa striata TaxID=64152 RepID=A0AA88ST67_CHASR|nr:hypothetical protein Q5P01_011172 [Channa striata]
MLSFLLLVMLTACAAIPQDLTGKMFTFPQETNSAQVRLTTSRQDLGAVTVCLRFLTDLRRTYSLFSLATPSAFNDFLVFNQPERDVISLDVRDKTASFLGQEYKLNVWHSLCSTWDSSSGLGQLWLDGKPSSRKFIRSGSNINGATVIVLGQEQDAYGGGFDIKQSFVGMMSDVHMWDHVLSPCEIKRFAFEVNFSPGNVLNWGALDFQITGRVLTEINQKSCQ